MYPVRTWGKLQMMARTRLFTVMVMLLCSWNCFASDVKEDAYFFYLQGHNFQYVDNDVANALLAYGKADIAMTDEDRSRFDFSGMYNDMGVLAMGVGDLEGATLAFTKALQIAPDFIPAISNLAGLKHSLGDLDTANKLYEVAVDLPGTSSEVLYNYGAFLSQVGQRMEARKYWQRTLEMKSDMHYAIASLASLHCTDGDLDAAFAMYEKAKEVTRQEGMLNFYHRYYFQQLLGVIPMLFDSTAHILRTSSARKFGVWIPWLLFDLSRNDIIPRQLHALLFSRVSSAYLYGDWPRATHTVGTHQQSIHIPPGLIDKPQSASSAENSATTSAGDRETEKRLRVGFMSAFFYHHSVGLLLQGVIKGLSRSLFHKTLILFTGMPQDNVTVGLLEACDGHMTLPAKTNLLHETVSSRKAILDLELDVLVFGEIGMDGATYFLSFARLARRSVVFWGHAITSGIVDFSVLHSAANTSSPVDSTEGTSLGPVGRFDWFRGGPDYFVSSELFESKKNPQNFYTERLILQQGMTTYFERPKRPLTATEMGLPPSQTDSSRCGPSSYDSCLLPQVAPLPERVHLVNHFAAPTSPSLRNAMDSAGITALSLHLYGVPQTLYKLCPEIVQLFGQVLLADKDGILVLPDGLDASVAQNAKSLMRRTIGDTLFSRVVFTRKMTGEEFITLCGVMDVVLDTFPVGGGRSSLEIFSTGTPIVLLYPKTSILQLSYGMYRTMGIDCRQCITYTEEEYIAGAIAIASNSTLQHEIRRDILRLNSRLYGNSTVLDEWSRMLFYVSSAPRPAPYAQYRSRMHPEEVGDDDDNSEDDVRVIHQDHEQYKDLQKLVPEVDMALFPPYKGLDPIRLAGIETNEWPQPLCGSSECSSRCTGNCRDSCLHAITSSGKNIAIAFLLSRGGSGQSTVEHFSQTVQSVEAALGYSIPGGIVEEVVVVDGGAEGIPAEEKVKISDRFRKFSYFFEKEFISRNSANSVRVSLNALSMVFRTVSPRHVLVLPTSWFISADGQQTQLHISNIHGRPPMSLGNILNVAMKVTASFEVEAEEGTDTADNALLMRQAAHVVVLDDPNLHHAIGGQWSVSAVNQDLASNKENAYAKPWERESHLALVEYLAGAGKTIVQMCDRQNSPSLGYCVYHNTNQSLQDTLPNKYSCEFAFGSSISKRIKRMCNLSSETGEIGSHSSFCELLNQASSYDETNPLELQLDDINNMTQLELLSPYLSVMMNLHLHPTLWDLDAIAALILREEQQFAYYPLHHQQREVPIARAEIQQQRRHSALHPSLVRQKEVRRADWATQERAAIVFDREDSIHYGTFSAKGGVGRTEWNKYHRVGALRFALRLLASSVRVVYIPYLLNAHR